jgi:hypothetical protein
MLAVCLFSRRRRVLIVDDVLKFEHGSVKEMANVRRTLNLLQQLPPSENMRIMLVSSNEGIGRLFNDNNKTTYHQVTFPAATDVEMVEALQRMKIPITTEEFLTAKAKYGGMPHHLYSTRWWRSLHLDGCAHIATSNDQIPRSMLRETALDLDLMCEPVARSYALAYSKEVDVASALKNFFTSDQVATVVSKYGERGPRRLVLTAALLVTGREARLRGEMFEGLVKYVCDEIQLAQQALTVATREHDRKPTPNTEERVMQAVKTLNDLQAYAERKKIGEAMPAADKQELVFATAIRRDVIHTGTVEAFQKDDQCIEEIGRIEGLLR